MFYERRLPAAFCYCAASGGNHFLPIIEKSHVDNLHARPQDYFSDADFLARLEKITLDQIEEALRPILAEHTEASEADRFIKEISAVLKERFDLYISVVGEGM